jgi:hypothetical protein
MTACAFVMASLGLLPGCGMTQPTSPKLSPSAQVRSASAESSDSPTVSSPSTDAQLHWVAEHQSSKQQLLRYSLRSALGDAVAAADALGGHASVALWLNGWSSPIVVRAGTPTYGRMWSMSKPVAVIATYQAAQRQGEGLGTSLVTAATDAITRSDNCAERRIILGLQQLTGGLAPALSAFDGVLAQAGDRVARTPERAALSEPTCLAYFRKRAPTNIPNAEAWEFGTDEWTVAQAAAFAHALATGVYGSTGRFAVTLMAMPKRAALTNIEGPSGDHIANLQWGAGTAFAPWHPAYKPGWGGSQQANFLTGQIVVLKKADPPVAIAAMFYPTTEPSTDDVGATAGPEALEAMFDRIREALLRMGVLREANN